MKTKTKEKIKIFLWMIGIMGFSIIITFCIILYTLAVFGDDLQDFLMPISWGEF